MRLDFGTAFESQKIRKRGMKLIGIASTCETKKKHPLPLPKMKSYKMHIVISCIITHSLNYTMFISDV